MANIVQFSAAPPVMYSAAPQVQQQPFVPVFTSAPPRPILVAQCPPCGKCQPNRGNPLSLPRILTAGVIGGLLAGVLRIPPGKIPSLSKLFGNQQFLTDWLAATGGVLGLGIISKLFTNRQC